MNTHVPWGRLLEFLNLPVRSQVLPAVTSCPLCNQQRLVIYDDNVFGGQWFYCQDCRKSGDLIQLAGKVWNLSLAAVIAKLARNDFNIPVEKNVVSDYLRVTVENRRRTSLFWKEARHRPFHSSTTVGRLIQELRLTCDVPNSREEAGPRRMLGVSNRHEVERLWHPNFSTLAGGARNQKRSFTGEHWDDLLVVPFRDLPNRYCGFLCIGRDGDPAKDFVYHRTLTASVPGGRYHPEEGGLAMHPEALAACDEWDNRLLATDNTVRMLQIQFRHFEQSTRPLPIAAWHVQNSRINVRTRHAWQWVKDKQIVFWMPFPSAETLSQAVSLDASIATNGPGQDDPTSWRSYLSKLAPRDLVKRLFDSSKHWTDVLAAMAESQTGDVLENLLLKLELSGLDLSRTIKLCSPRAAKRLRELLRKTDKGGSVQVNGRTFYEKNDGWYCQVQGREELIVDAVLQIEEIVQHTKTKVNYYKGFIKYQGRKIPFCEAKNVVNAATFKWMDSVLSDNGISALRFNASRSASAVFIAMQFHQPKFTQFMDTIGWQGKEAKFVLPRYAIELGGKVTDQDGSIFSHNVPARVLPKPEELSGLDVAPLLGDRKTSELLWAVLLPTLGNIVAEAFNEQPVGIGLRGAGAEAMGEAVAEALGCHCMELSTKKDVEIAVEAEHRHNWPVFLQRGTKLSRPIFREWLESDRRRNHNALIALDWWQYTLKSISGAWTMVEAEHGAPLRHDAVQALRKFVPAYLKDLASRQLKIGVWHEQSSRWLDELAKDVQKFLKPIDDNARRVVEALKLVRGYHEDGNAEAFADIVSEMVSSRLITVVQEGFEEPGCPALLQSERGLLVPRLVLTEALAKHCLVPPDPLRLSAVLSHAGVLVEEKTEGWLIDEPWWRECHKRRRALGSGQLKIHG